jgi:cation diffusion facilitator CzcD-associated flavoprotein CzcO
MADDSVRHPVAVIGAGPAGLATAAALRARGVRSMVHGAKVCLADGTAIEPDVIVTATGYRRGLEPLVGSLGVLDASGRPLVHGARTHHAAPGLHFVGYTNPVSGMFREIAIAARRIAAALSRNRTRRTP